MASPGAAVARPESAAVRCRRTGFLICQVGLGRGLCPVLGERREQDGPASGLLGLPQSGDWGIPLTEENKCAQELM